MSDQLGGQWGSQIDFHKEQTQRQTKCKHETGSKGDMGSELEEVEHVSYIKLMQLSFAVTSLHNEVLADNVYTRTPCPNLGIQAQENQDTLSVVHHLTLR